MSATLYTVLLKFSIVPKVLASIIATIIPQILGENIAYKKIDAETKVNKASDQAIYFFSTLNRLRMQSDEKRFNRNPFKIRKRMSSQSSMGSGSHRRQSSIGSGSHRRANSYSSLNMKRINSQSSFGNGSQRSLNSIQSVDGIGDSNSTRRF